ncbi:major facilitator superfamily domain-containing protein [Corynascus similis CBS 632.67]
MPLGILECDKMEVVPGTAFMADQDDLPPEYAHVPQDQLKHGKGRFANVILVPQPSDDPNDPLNWPQWRKELVLVVCGLAAAVVGAYGPMLSPGMLEIADDLSVSLNELTQSTAWLTLCICLGLFVTNPLAKIIGRRPIYLAAAAIMLAVSVAGALVRAGDYTSFLAPRIIAGLGMAPFEVLVQCTIGDMYFVHERATRIAVWNLLLLTGIAGGSLVAGYIIERNGYQWTFGVCAILFGVVLLAVFFLVPETAYRRGNAVEAMTTTATVVGNGSSDGHAKLAAGHEHHLAGVSVDDREGLPEGSKFPKKRTYIQSLRVWTGRYSQAPGWKPFARPVVMLFYPAVLWGFLVYGTVITWIVVFSVVNAAIFTLPPYNFSVSETGLISLSPFIMTIVGELVSGPLNDWICVYLTRKNRGIYEPEFRLPLMAVSLVLGVVGFYGFGATVHYQTHWTGPVLCFGFANMSMVFASTCVFGYIIDSYRRHNEEALVAINARNLLTFGLTYFVNDWLAQQGALIVFCILGSLFVFVVLLTIPLWIFGKKFRSFTGRNAWLQQFMNDDH